MLQFRNGGRWGRGVQGRGGAAPRRGRGEYRWLGQTSDMEQTVCFSCRPKAAVGLLKTQSLLNEGCLRKRQTAKRNRKGHPIIGQ